MNQPTSHDAPDKQDDAAQRAADDAPENNQQASESRSGEDEGEGGPNVDADAYDDDDFEDDEDDDDDRDDDGLSEDEDSHASLAAELRDVDLFERGLLVGVELSEARDGWTIEASMDELTALAATAGVEIVGRATQRLRRPVSATYVGKGKVSEIKSAAGDLKADVVLFDHELSPRQQRNLEAELDIKVLDRTALILDVFAKHARTREGMLQVELAQNEYRLPRLTRLWTHLARQAGGRAGGAGGGVGLRGPGETQIEIDRRLISSRISLLNGQIDKLRTQRKQSRKSRGRAGLPVIALVGYTNAGKSTLINTISGTHIYAADQLFATLDPTTRRIDLPSGRPALMTDTVGFIQKLPTQLVAAFRATLEEIGEADLLLHVVDATHPDALQQAETVEHVLDDMGLSERPMVVAANKVDRLPGGAEDPSLGELISAYPDLVPVSAAKNKGVRNVLAAIDAELRTLLAEVELLIPFREGALVSRIHEHGLVEHEGHTAEGTRLRARVPLTMLASLASYEVEPAD